MYSLLLQFWSLFISGRVVETMLDLNFWYLKPTEINKIALRVKYFTPKVVDMNKNQRIYMLYLYNQANVLLKPRGSLH